MIKMYVATISNPDILYVGMDNDMKRKFFKVEKSTDPFERC